MQTKMTVNTVRYKMTWKKRGKEINSLQVSLCAQNEESNQVRAAWEERSERIKSVFEKEWKEVKVE